MATIVINLHFLRGKNVRGRKDGKRCPLTESETEKTGSAAEHRQAGDTPLVRPPYRPESPAVLLGPARDNGNDRAITKEPGFCPFVKVAPATSVK
ncbi:hypothetical protein SKAU_G00429340 [Synaphobranchus kaupii]|uniref:Uncharacterized protein n=1 Tax=Synaphobranchus kaupii TaxID=118154 RepID=A0A9Q1E4G2_SYNKA|nr:hypothetical protein SKAU_G00429340 [Synaphobranchus kaupii]